MQLHKSLGSLGSGGSKSAATGSEAIMACYGNILPSLAKLPLLKGPAGPYIRFPTSRFLCCTGYEGQYIKWGTIDNR